MSDKVSNVAPAHNMSKRAIKTKNTDRSTPVFPLFEFLFRANGALSDSISRVCTQEPLSISKKIIVRLHTLSRHNILLVHYKVYSPDPRECLCTGWKYPEAYENFSIEPATCRKNPIKKQSCQIKLPAPTTRRKLHWNKSVTATVFWENFVRYVLKKKQALK